MKGVTVERTRAFLRSIGLPDRERGELVCAVVEPEPGQTMDLPTLVAHLTAAGIMKQKLPERLELPHFGADRRHDPSFR